MTVTGIIAEYNPFHNGHKYQIEKARQMTGADYIAIIMGGNFMQRGTPALCDKYMRAKMALENGADIVIELPVCYATGSAEYFAKGSVSLLDQLDIVDYLCFGSEEGDITLIQETAALLHNETPEFQSLLQENLKKGLSFPLAREAALKEVLPEIPTGFLSSPNNILGIEYCKALLEFNSSIKPVTVQREISSYHDRDLPIAHSSSTNNSTADTFQFCSATALRHAFETNGTKADDIHSDIFQEAFATLSCYVPDSVAKTLQEEYQKSYPVFSSDFDNVLGYKLLETALKGYTDYADISEDLSDKLRKNLYEYRSFDDFCVLLKSKELTYSRISRCLSHLLLSIKKEDISAYLSDTITYYAHVLGMKKDLTPLTKGIKSYSTIPLITNPTEGLKLLTGNGLTQFQTDIFASQLYQSVVSRKYNQPFKNDFKQKFMVID